jgi:hypothetical protein
VDRVVRFGQGEVLVAIAIEIAHHYEAPTIGNEVRLDPEIACAITQYDRDA